jgi:hypothetical protein
MKATTLAGALAALLITSGHALAQTAPGPLHGKSVYVSWVETRMQRKGAETEFTQRALPQSLTVYVSTNGQIFARRAASNGNRGAGSHDNVGSAGSSNVGGARVARFSGHNLNVTAALLGGGARSIVVTFDQGFAGCSASIVLGHESGRSIKGKSLISGEPLEIQSATAGNTSCSIREGNAFAS